MLRFLLDTNLCIRVLRDRTAPASGEIQSSSGIVGDLDDRFDGTLTRLLAKSARQDANRREVENFAARLEVLPFDIAAAHHAADIRGTLERQGRAIGGFDILIAGHARSRALTVVTGNRGEFDRAPGLQCEDWG